MLSYYQYNTKSKEYAIDGKLCELYILTRDKLHESKISDKDLVAQYQISRLPHTFKILSDIITQSHFMRTYNIIDHISNTNDLSKVEIIIYTDIEKFNLSCKYLSANSNFHDILNWYGTQEHTLIKEKAADKYKELMGILSKPENRVDIVGVNIDHDTVIDIYRSNEMKKNNDQFDFSVLSSSINAVDVNALIMEYSDSKKSMSLHLYIPTYECVNNMIEFGCKIDDDLKVAYDNHNAFFGLFPCNIEIYGDREEVKLGSTVIKVDKKVKYLPVRSKLETADPNQISSINITKDELENVSGVEFRKIERQPDNWFDRIRDMFR